MTRTPRRVEFKRSFTTAMGVLLFVLFWNAAPALGQGPSPFQLRVTGTCPVDYSIIAINPDGTVVCEPTGVGSCSVGSFISSINTNGTVTCALDSDSGGTVKEVTASHPLKSTGGNTPNISLPDVIIGHVLTNTAIGFSALSSNTIGFGNTASGTAALLSNTKGEVNTASGVSALESNTEGSINTAIGAFALRANIIGNYNTAIGEVALRSNTEGNSNTASGASALLKNTEGSDNSASGVRALESNTTGSLNTASGAFSLLNNTTGEYNTALGALADVAFDNLTNATAIGANAIVTQSNMVRIGDANVMVIEGHVAFTYPSDRNLKEHFKPLDGEDVLNKLRQIPVQSWSYIGQSATDFRHYGPVAQDLFAAFGHDGIGTVGTPTTINSGDMAGILMAAIQALETRTAELNENAAKVAELESRLKSLERLIQDRH